MTYLIALILWAFIGIYNLTNLRNDAKRDVRFKYYFWQYWFAWFLVIFYIVGKII